MNRFIPDWSIDDYYNQSKCRVPAFSYSTAKVLWQKSPAHCYLEHSKLGGQKRESTAAMDFGSAVHSVVLGKGKEVIKSEYDNFKSKEAQEWKAKQEAENKIILKQDDFQRCHEIKAAFYRQMADFGLLKIFEESEKEAMAEYEYNDVYTISMFDTWSDGVPVIFDLKTCTDASPKALQRKIQDMVYDIQSVLYRKAAEIIRPDLAGRVRFIFLFIETEAPYCLTPVELDGIGDALGESKLNYTANLWRGCLESGKWPGYVNGVITLDTPMWASKEVESKV